jgi:hypothetical protein
MSVTDTHTAWKSPREFRARHSERSVQYTGTQSVAISASIPMAFDDEIATSLSLLAMTALDHRPAHQRLLKGEAECDAD